MAKNVVATSQPLAAQAGLSMLQKGGNAVDAALAAAITLTVVEPTSNGIGSDAFCILWDGQELHGLNASGKSPQALTAEKFAGMTQIPPRSWDAVTVPGCVSAWVALSERFGKLDFQDLFQPAISYANNGYLVSPITAKAWTFSEKTFANSSDFAPFLPNGRAPRAGERFSFPDQGKTLADIAATKGKSFYEGTLAQKIAAHAKATGGLMTEEDLASHECEWVGTIQQSYNGIELHEIPPNGQGLAALIMLGILEHYDIKQYPVDSADSLHLQIEAMKLAFADAHRYVSDSRTMDVSVDDLLDSAYLAERAKFIDMSKAQVPDYGIPQNGGTVYLTTADESGMMVSFIQSNYMGFGSGIVVPETGISLQNRGAGFTLEDGHPNQVAGGKRPFHTIIPAFLTQGGKPLMSYGVMGGPMQPQGHAQMVIRMCDYGQNPQTCSDAPRWQVLKGLEVAMDSGFSAEVVAALKQRGHDIKQSRQDAEFAMGGAQLIYRLEDGYLAASDHRKDGQAVGY